MDEKWGTCPIVFVDETKKKEWEAMDESVKKACLQRIHETTKRIGVEASIELLCHVYNDLSARIDKIEQELK